MEKIKLLASTGKLDEENIKKLLESLEDDEISDDDKETRRLGLIEDNIIEALIACYASGPKELIAQCIAELAKTDSARRRCIAAGVVVPLLDRLKESTSTQSEAIQACRALGNICFDCDDGRQAICEHKGLENVLDLLRRQMSDTCELAGRLRKVACGFLFNLTNSNTILIEKALSLGVLQILDEYLKIYCLEEDISLMVLLAVGALADTESGQIKLMSSDIMVTIGQLLTHPESTTELKESALDLFSTLVESDDVKAAFAENGLFTILLDLLKSPPARIEERRLLEKMIFDLITLLLTGDNSMTLLFADGRGRILSEALDWMKSSDELFQISGALAIGNLARTDKHCVELVQRGLTEDLLILLERHPVNSTTDPTLQHAVLGALRNLAIPIENKRRMLDCRLLPRLLPYGQTEMTIVAFKLLATFRMAIDQQADAALLLGTNEEFLPKLVKWCATDDHVGVKGEANRLVASLIKHSHSSDVMNAIMRHGAMPFLLQMSQNEHAIMQNEALIALALISATILDSVEESLLEFEALSNLKDILNDTLTLPEVLHNTLSLLKTLIRSKIIMQRLNDEAYTKVIRRFAQHSDVKLQSLATSILSELASR